MRSIIYQLILFLYTNNQDDVYALAARNLLMNIEEIKTLSITEVASICYVSPATISRLCRKLGMESFAEFKHAINNDYNQPYNNRYFSNYAEMKNQKCSTQDLINTHYQEVTDSIKNTYQSLDLEVIKKICEMIYYSEHVIFTGLHNAHFSSIQFQEKLTYLGKDCYGSLNTNEQINLLKNATENDVIILASLSGGIARSNPDIMRNFKHSKAKKIVFSHAPELKQYADVIIDIQGGNDTLIAKFNLTYIYEILEMIYCIQYEEE